MKKLEVVLKRHVFTCLDGRDKYRLAQFLTNKQIKALGLIPNPGKHVPIPFTRENILAQLEKDVAFGFEKALDKRGISSALMYEVVRMWNWILEEGLEFFNHYAQYGLPLFKATALKYGFDNPIGDDEGDEFEYSSDYEGN